MKIAVSANVIIHILALTVTNVLLVSFLILSIQNATQLKNAKTTVVKKTATTMVNVIRTIRQGKQNANVILVSPMTVLISAVDVPTLCSHTLIAILEIGL